jgi:arsenate reductase
MDYVLTVCDDAAETVNPVWPGQPISAHWQVRDPEAVQGDEATKHQAIVAAAANLRRRIELFVSLPTDSLDRLSIQSAVINIGKA